MAVKHARRNRLVVPPGFFELPLRGENAGRNQATKTVARITRRYESDAGSGAPVSPATSTPTTAPFIHEELDERQSLLLGGVGVFRVPIHGSARGTLSERSPPNVFLTSTFLRIRAYYEAMPARIQARRLVPPSVVNQQSRFNTPLLQEALKFCLSAGRSALSQTDQRSLAALFHMAESGDVKRQRRDGRRIDGRLWQRRRLCGDAGWGHFEAPASRADVHHEMEPADGASSQDRMGELEREFPTRSSFLAAVLGEKRRVLAKHILARNANTGGRSGPLVLL